MPWPGALELTALSPTLARDVLVFTLTLYHEAFDVSSLAALEVRPALHAARVRCTALARLWQEPHHALTVTTAIGSQ